MCIEIVVYNLRISFLGNEVKIVHPARVLIDTLGLAQFALDCEMTAADAEATHAAVRYLLANVKGCRRANGARNGASGCASFEATLATPKLRRAAFISLF
jgi:hypothetical protein